MAKLTIEITGRSLQVCVEAVLHTLLDDAIGSEHIDDKTIAAIKDGDIIKVDVTNCIVDFGHTKYTSGS